MDAAGVASLLTAAEVVITRLKEPKAEKEGPGNPGEVDDYNGAIRSRSRYYS